jgi:K+-sensing histidine kinase KdpD
MEQSDYIAAWTAYLIAAVIFSALAWRVLRRLPWRELAYVLECWLLALLFTPWYVLEDQDILAPALMVTALDTFTIAPTAGVRAFVPLLLTMFVMLMVAVLLSVVHRVRRRKARAAEPELEEPSV